MGSSEEEQMERVEQMERAGEIEWLALLLEGFVDNFGKRRSVHEFFDLPEEAVRIRAAEALGNILGDADEEKEPLFRHGIKALIAALEAEFQFLYWNVVTNEWMKESIRSHPYASVRLHAAKALGKIDDEYVVKKLIKVVQSKSDGRDDWTQFCVAAVGALGDIGDTRAVEPLIKTLHGEDFLVRWRAVEALGEIGDARAVEPLGEELGNSPKYALESVILGTSPDPSADKDYCMDIVYALCEIGNPRAVELLIGVLSDDNDEFPLNDKQQDYRDLGLPLLPDYVDVIITAVDGLGKIGDPRAVKPLIEALGHHETDVRLHAAKALGKIGDETAVVSLIEALDDDDEEVGECAADSLVNIGNVRALDFLHNKGFAEAHRKLKFKLLAEADSTMENVEQTLTELKHKQEKGEIEEADQETLDESEETLRQDVKPVAETHGDSKMLESMTRLLGAVSDLRPHIQTTTIEDSVVSRSTIGADGDDKFAKVDRLAEMKEKGLIDAAEFQQMKKEILGK